jgi:hypothetical protein
VDVVSRSGSSKRRHYSDFQRHYKPPGARHKPWWRRKECDDCGLPVIVAEEDDGRGRLRGILLEAEPAGWGILVRKSDGYITRDPEKQLLSDERWLWHRCAVRNGVD